MKAVILCGGKGTRLYPLTSDIPKAMVRLAGKPVLEHIISFLKENDLTNIVLCTGHLSQIIENYFGDGSSFGVNLVYSREEMPLSTGGALALAKEKIADDFILLNGDNICTINVQKLILFHKEKNALLTIGVGKTKGSYPASCDLFAFNKEFAITNIIFRPHQYITDGENLPLGNLGIFCCSREILKDIPQIFVSFEKLLPTFLSEGKRIYAYPTNEYASDIGTQESLRAVEEDLVMGRTHLFIEEKK